MNTLQWSVTCGELIPDAEWPGCSEVSTGARGNVVWWMSDLEFNRSSFSENIISVYFRSLLFTFVEFILL